MGLSGGGRSHAGIGSALAGGCGRSHVSIGSALAGGSRAARGGGLRSFAAPVTLSAYGPGAAGRQIGITRTRADPPRQSAPMSDLPRTPRPRASPSAPHVHDTLDPRAAEPMGGAQQKVRYYVPYIIYNIPYIIYLILYILISQQKVRY